MSRFIIILLLTSLIFIGLWIFTFKSLLKTKKAIKELEKTIDNQKKNLIYIVRHSQELAEIDKTRTKVDQEISEAKSDEEVVNIINTIIDTNNNRLHDNQNK